MRSVRFSDLLTLGDPRDPTRVRQHWILQRDPERCRIVAGAPALASELRQRWRDAGGSDTSQTERFAAGLLAARRIVIRGVPEMCTGRASFWVE